MMEFSPALALVVIALLAAGLLWQWARAGRLASEKAALEAKLQALEGEKAVLLEDKARLATEREALDRRGVELVEALAAEKLARAEVQATLAAERKAHEARLEELRGAREELENKFASLAQNALRNNADQFLKIASERFKVHEQATAEEVEKKRVAIETLVKPLHEKLQTFDQHLHELEKARKEAQGAIQEQVKQLAEGQITLGQETRRLVQALRAPKTRGRWGEMQLRQVFELAGMAEHVDFTLEHHVETDGGRKLRPDAVVRIPGGKSIVIDAKTPLEAYLDAIEADTPETQGMALKRHAEHVRTHVRQLAAKDYQEALETTPDFVVMFIPGETFVSAALEADPGLFEFALKNKVLIATPTTLIALVKAIAYGWQQEKLAKNAEEIQKNARELYERLGVFAGHLGKVGKGLESAVKNYNSAVGSLEGRVLPAARRFEGMGVVAEGRALDGPKMVEGTARPMTRDFAEREETAARIEDKSGENDGTA